MENKFYGRVKTLLGSFLKLFFRIKVIGADNEIPGGPVLLCANHMSNVDPVILGAVMRRQVRFMAKSELFRVPVLRSLVRALGAYSVDRGKSDVSAVKTTLALLQSGEQVCVFVQGRRFSGIDPRETKVKNGAGLLCKRSRASVLPVHIYTKNYKFRLFKRIYVLIGEPIGYPELADCVGADGESGEYSRMTAVIFERICRQSRQITDKK